MGFRQVMADNGVCKRGYCYFLAPRCGLLTLVCRAFRALRFGFVMRNVPLPRFSD